MPSIMQPEFVELLKLESQRLLLMLRIEELETGSRPNLEDLFPTRHPRTRPPAASQQRAVSDDEDPNSTSSENE